MNKRAFARRFGRKIRSLRRNVELSQKVVAAALHITPSYLCDMEQGKRNPPCEKILTHMAPMFGVSEDYMVLLAGKVPSRFDMTIGSCGAVETAWLAFMKEWHKQLGMIDRLEEEGSWEMNPLSSPLRTLD